MDIDSVGLARMATNKACVVSALAGTGDAIVDGGNAVGGLTVPRSE